MNLDPQLSQALLDALLGSPVGVAVLDHTLHYRHVNAAFEAMRNRTLTTSHPPSINGRTVREVVPSLADQLEPALQRTFETGQPLLGLEIIDAKRVWMEHLIPLNANGERWVAVIVEEPTDQNAVNGGLDESAQLSRALLEHLPGCAVFLLNRDLRYQMAAGETLRAVGLAPSDLVGRSVFEAIAPEVAAQSMDFYRAAFEGVPFELEHEAYGRTFSTRGVPWRTRTDDGAIDAVLVVSYDVTKRQRLEADRAWLAAMVQSSIDAVISIDLEDTVLSWNPAAERMFGSSAFEVLGTRFERFVPPALRAEHDSMLERVSRGEDVVQLETMRHRSDGSSLDASLTASPLRDANGQIVALTVVVQDITERKQAERELQASEARYRELVAQVKDHAIFGTDLQGMITTWNEGCERVLGYSSQAFLGLDLRELFTPEDRAAGMLEYEFETAAREGVSSDDRWMMRRGVERFWASGTTSAVFDANGTLQGFTKVMRDLTSEKRAEDRLREINNTQRRFVADAAHELRAPLTSIRGNLEIMLRYPNVSAPERLEMLGDAERESARLSRLITNLLTLARGDARQHGEFRPQRLDELLTQVLRSTRSLAVEHQLVIEQLVPVTVIGNSDELQQLTLVLLENALKYTPSGGVVRIWLEVSDGWVELRIADDGPGIAPHDLEHVFERFYRADLARTPGRDPGGTGLGLSIAQIIAEAHGGRIWLESELGLGTIAVVRLPLVLDEP